MTDTARRLLLLSLAALAALAAPLAGQVEIERRKPVPKRGVLSVDSDFGTITVRAWDRPEVLLRGVVAAGVEDADLDVDEEGASVSVSVPEAWLHASGEDTAFRSTLEIQAPLGWAVDVETLNAAVRIEGFAGPVEATSVNSAVTVVGATARIDVETMTGAVTVEARGAPMGLRTISGGVVARGASDEVGVETVSDNIEISGAALRRLQVETFTGTVEIRGSLAPDGTIEVETFSSSARLVLPKSVRTRFDLESFSGEIESVFCAGTPLVHEPFEPFRKLRCSTGSDDSEIQVKTHSGGIVVAAE
jgi:hypothetical protein